MSTKPIHAQTVLSQKDEESFLQGVKDCLPTLLGYVSIGIAAGVVMTTAGLSISEITLFCLLLYAGSAQFIAVGMMASSSSVTAIAITTLFVNARYILLSASISPYFKHLSSFKNFLVGTLLSDETFGVAMNKAVKTKEINEKWMHGLNITAYLGWWLANLAGAYLGQWITNPEQWGLDFALVGMFIGLLVLSLAGRKNMRRDLVVGIVAVVVGIGSTFIVSGSFGIIIATVVAATVGMGMEKWK
ncbi:AzlC family ABC transporter permease [Paenibacillus sp. OAS669]|uniref:AzlC family ABC transporter permease n=1 Tax=Paenibacillus sp. OAS669 TaxID=2663821 RepID=UPI00178B1644|nr:AzlC family ABC transporter permease [Paenibacillus sp. OAS669]MBE1442356.1 4-azaleucine resistance transporter AzlC [Paenibacillus sp. OAS669]